MNTHLLPRGKRLMVLAGLLFAAAAGAVMLLSSVAKTLYWKESHLENAVLGLAEYGERIAGNDSGLDEVKAAVHKCNEAAVPVRPELSPFFEACNDMIVRYFQDIFDVDVTDKLNALQVMEAAYPEAVSQMVGGSHSSDFPNSLFINAAVLGDLLSDMENGELPEIDETLFSVKMLRTVYIHEVMHYLGFNSDTGLGHFMEAAAEFLNQEVMLHSGIKYESITGYAQIQGFAAQIAACNPAFVREILSEGRFEMDTYFNGSLGGGPEINCAECYDGLIGLLQKGDGDTGRIRYYAQYLTYEYCKAANSSAREILSGGNAFTVGLFEIKWFVRTALGEA